MQPRMLTVKVPKKKLEKYGFSVLEIKYRIALPNPPPKKTIKNCFIPDKGKKLYCFFKLLS